MDGQGCFEAAFAAKRDPLPADVARRNLRAPSVRVLLGAVILLTAASSAAAALKGAAGGPAPGETEKRLCRKYLDVLEHSVDSFEPLWTDVSEVPDAGFFDFRRYRNWRSKSYETIIMVPGNGMAVLCYAVLLGETRQDTFGRSGTSRKTLLEHAAKAVRWCCRTSAYVEHGIPYLPGSPPEMTSGRQWKRPLGYRADILGYLTLGTALLWDVLDDETRSLFAQVAQGAAAPERVVWTFAAPMGGNHDQVKKDLAATLGAAYLVSSDDRQAQFMRAVAGAGIDLVSTLQDFAKPVTADGKPVRELAQGWNLFEDYTSDHHGRASLWYGGDALFEGRYFVEIMAAVTGGRVPQTFTYDGNGFDGVLEWLLTLSLAGGGLMHPHGVEYDYAYGEGLLAFAYGAAIKQDRRAAFLEIQAADLLARHVQAVPQYDYHRGSWAKAAMAYLLHRIHPGGPYEGASPSVLSSLEGVRHYRDQQCFVHRAPGEWVSFTWGSLTSPEGAGPCGLVAPSRVSEPPLVYSHPSSLAGVLVCHAPGWTWGGLIGVAGIGALAVAIGFRLRRVTCVPFVVCAALSVALGLALALMLDGGCVLDKAEFTVAFPIWPGTVLGGIAALVLGAAALSCGGGALSDRLFAYGAALVAPLLGSAGLMALLLGNHMRQFEADPLGSPLVHVAVAVTALAGLMLLRSSRRWVRAAGSLAAVGLLGITVALAVRVLAGDDAGRFIQVRFRPYYLVAALAASGGAAAMAVALIAAARWNRRALAMITAQGGIVACISAAVAMYFSIGHSAWPLGRAGYLPCLAALSHRWSLSDDRFSTAGCASWQGAAQHEAFFSFERGPSVVFAVLTAQVDGPVSWSGLPVYLFVREGLTEPHEVSSEAGTIAVPDLRITASSWWCVDGGLGLAVLGGNGRIRGARTLGFNWARTPAYLDRSDMIVVSPLDRAEGRRGAALADLCAAMYAGVASRDVRTYAARLQDLTPVLPRGWRGVVAPSAAAHGARVLALVNFTSDVSTAPLELSFPEGAPVLEHPAVVKGRTVAAAISLGTLQTFGQPLELYVEGPEDRAVAVLYLDADHVQVTVPGDRPVDLVWRYRGPLAVGLKAVSRERQVVGTCTPAEVRSEAGARLTVSGYACIELEGLSESDGTPPAVEISRIEVPRPGRLAVWVEAADRSGLASVTLFCDTRQAGESLKAPPYRWDVDVAAGWHTFQASAVDGSAKGNTRRSFCRTVQVAAGPGEAITPGGPPD